MAWIGTDRHSDRMQTTLSTVHLATGEEDGKLRLAKWQTSKSHCTVARHGNGNGNDQPELKQYRSSQVTTVLLIVMNMNFIWRGTEVPVPCFHSPFDLQFNSALPGSLNSGQSPLRIKGTKPEVKKNGIGNWIRKLAEMVRTLQSIWTSSFAHSGDNSKTLLSLPDSEFI